MIPIELQKNNQHLIIDQLGGGVAEYYIENKKIREDIIYGYRDHQEKGASMMGDVLFPFPGRVKDGKYEFAGKNYRLSGVDTKDGQAIHGFAKNSVWEIIKKDQDRVTVEFYIRKDKYQKQGFPFSLKIQLDYQLISDGFSCQTLVENIGDSPAPFGLGFHPYFTLGGGNINSIKLKIKAKKLIEFDRNLIPTGKLIDLNKKNDLDFSYPKTIGEREIDNCYFDLYFNQGIATTEISNDRGRKIAIWQNRSFPYLQIYSADTIGERHARRGLAIEPQTCTGFAFNKPDFGLKILDPGKKFFGEWGVRRIN